jgi:hypothetical protein
MPARHFVLQFCSAIVPCTISGRPLHFILH